MRRKALPPSAGVSHFIFGTTLSEKSRSSIKRKSKAPVTSPRGRSCTAADSAKTRQCSGARAATSRKKYTKLKEGHVFILKPAAKQGFMRDSIRAGDTVAIEANGARRLGKRDLQFSSV